MTNTGVPRRIVTALMAGAFLLSAAACHRSAGGSVKADADEAPGAAAPLPGDKGDKDRDEALNLTSSDMVKLGIVVAPLAAADFHAEATGYAMVVGRDAVIQALSEIEVAQVRATQSHAALERSRKLAGTPGADAVTEQESTVRQNAEDRSALKLARAKMSSLLGQQAARALGADPALVDGLSAGRYKLIRATLPLGVVHGDAPPALRLARLDAEPGDFGWRALRVWSGPVDSGVPGRTFLGLVDAPALAEGERLMAYASSNNAAAAAGKDAQLQGALVPSSAMVVAAGEAWMYVEHDPGRFSRERLDTTHPVPAGYFVMGRPVAGTRVITAGAGMLLSRELDLSPED